MRARLPPARAALGIVVAGAFLLVLAAPLRAAVDPLQPAGSGGVAELSRDLDRLAQHRRLMIIGAHPDDEDDSLLSVASLGDGTEVAYLSLTRGEGGQNVIGDELGESLGVLRSEELLAGRRVDRGRQLFTRAYDFGYTESMAESFTKWPREELLVDVVRAIRRFRPQVVVAVFPPDERAGHGQHQVSGALADDAMRVAGDPAALPQLAAEGLAPWQPEAFFREAWRDPTTATVVLSSQRLDPLTGHTLYQIAMDVRSLHRSQSEGQLQALEGRPVNLRREAPAVEGQDALFAGVDTHLTSLARLLPAGPEADELQRLLADVEAAAGEARNGLAPGHLAEAEGPLARALRDLRDAEAVAASSPGAATDGGHLATFLAEKEATATDALVAALGLVVDATADRAEVVPGSELAVSARVLDGGPMPLRIESLMLESPAGWTAPVNVALTPPATTGATASTAGSAEGSPLTATTAAPSTPPTTTDIAAPADTTESAELAAAPEPPPAPPPVFIEPGAVMPFAARVTVDPATSPTAPYFLQRPRQGDLYDWTDVPPAVRGEPFEPPPLRLRAVLDLDTDAGPLPITVTREVVSISRSLSRGEVRRPLRAVPAVEVSLAQGMLPWPLADTKPRRLLVTLDAHKAVEGQLSVLVPDGWPAVPLQPFQLPAGEKRTFELPLAPPSPLAAGRTSVEVGAITFDGGRYFQSFPLVDYEHVRPRPIPVPSRVAISAFPLELPKLQAVGYVRGAADHEPEALLAVGVPLQVLAPADLLSRDLADFDAIVIGPRAYDAAPELAAANSRLQDFVRAGGLLVVQSQRNDYFAQKLAPLPLDMPRGNATRTTDETAAVRLLQPDHAAFTTPNAIDASDWEGWVQERGLYYPQTWDPAYVPLVAMADPGKPELSGALLVAPYGQGTFVYTGLAFFRQLPAGVPGAYRLFANLLALAKPRVQSEDLPAETP
ncbi:MAG TPA: PIG-L family deacetylase [Thermoanaerobaculia bacterium]|jgi:LmbE family N-acetylglucosaminyl deacetylase|nr:PIG-L family deacetylase [Thermoanaerobaculia bacterium]